MRRIGFFIPVLVIMLVIGGIMPANLPVIQAKPYSCPPTCFYAYLPLATVPPTVFQGGLIINHENIDIDQVPDYWLGKAKELAFHYGHTSHGEQVLEGLAYLESYLDSKYDISRWSLWEWNDHLTDDDFPATPLTLNIYDGNYDSSGYDDYIEPGDYWEGPVGISRTTTTASSGNFDYSMWSWCGQADYYSDDQIGEYLAQMKAFEAAFPNMRFILMTGHNVSNGDDGADNDNLLAHNQMMRDYANANGMVLFDFADIETYDPDDLLYDPNTWNYSDGTCPWCETWCAANPGYCDDDLLAISCEHTHPLFCKMKAQAFWWMMARLAGWGGPVTSP